MKKSVFLALSFAILLLVAILLIQAANKQKKGAKNTADQMDQIAVQLQWFDGPQFLGFYAALGQGYYKENNLNVNLLQGGYTTDAINAVRTDDNIQIGLATGDQVLIQFEKTRDFVAMGTVFNQSVAGFLVRDSSGIKHPSHLIGKDVGVYKGFDTENLLLAMLHRAGIEKSEVNITDAGNLEAFFNGNLDAFPAYSFNEPIVAKKQGVRCTLLRPEDFGVKSYSDTIIANREWYLKNPDVAKRFIEATQKGWEWSKKNEDVAVRGMYETLKGLNRMTKPLELDEKKALAVVNKVGTGPRGTPLVMDPNRWMEMENWLHQIGKIKSTGLYTDLCDFTLAKENSD